MPRTASATTDNSTARSDGPASSVAPALFNRRTFLQHIGVASLGMSAEVIGIPRRIYSGGEYGRLKLV